MNHVGKYLIAVLFAAVLAGCSARVVGRVGLATEIDQFARDTRHHAVYYAGSDDAYHYFVVTWQGIRDHQLKVIKHDLDIKAPFPRTDDTKQWLSIWAQIGNVEHEHDILLFRELGRTYYMKKPEE